MEFRWLKQDQAAEAIVVFGGWAVGPEVFWHLKGGQDILYAGDYTSLDADLPDLGGYSRVSLVAWSFGVAAYAHWQEGRPDPFARKVAVNGSMQPVHRGAGIPPAVFRKTTETLNVETYQTFLSRVFGAPQNPEIIDVEARRAELLAVERRGDAPRMRFDRIWISSNDKIFPPANLTRSWAGQNTSVIEAPHAPFDRFEDWEELF